MSQPQFTVIDDGRDNGGEQRFLKVDDDDLESDVSLAVPIEEEY